MACHIALCGQSEGNVNAGVRPATAPAHSIQWWLHQALSTQRPSIYALICISFIYKSSMCM